MANIKYDLYKITALTNMHVGSGDISFAVIDNLVQRDPVTGYPVIFSSSIKGALREFFTQGGKQSAEFINYVFGGSPSEKESRSGAYKFFGAYPLSIPVRSNIKPFFRATCPAVIKEFRDTFKQFEVNISIGTEIETFLDVLNETSPEKAKPFVFEELGEDVRIENFQAHYEDINVSPITAVFGGNLALFHDDDFKEFCTDLPVIARNYLENGESKNLWYEEIVPRQTLFYFVVATPESEAQETLNYDKEFGGDLTENLIQIGANATIGYGITKFEKLNQEGSDEET